MRHFVAALMALALLGTSCADGGEGERSANPATPADSGTATPSLQPSPSIIPSPSPLPTVIPEEVGFGGAESGVLRIGPAGAALTEGPGMEPVGRLRAGVLVAFEQVEGEWARVTTPCALTRWVQLSETVRLVPAQVVLDPGHGGDETGAVGPGGLLEKDVNLRVASRAAELLNLQGVPTVLTREQDYRAALKFRAGMAEVADPDVFVSVHHNADPDGPMDRPGTETFYQYRSSDSKRLAGLVYEETVGRLSGLSAEWVGDTDAGAKWRLNSRGTDYYGLLRLTAEAGVPSVLAELSFISNASEEELLRRQDVIDLEAQAVANGILRYLQTRDPGSGFSTPYPRQQPAGPGGGTAGCVDPS